MAIIDRLRSALRLVGLLAVTVAGGCHLDLMHTPVGYTTGVIDPFEDLPKEARTPGITIFYATDRPASGSPTDRKYRNGRGPVRLGEATLRIGGSGMTWQQLHAASTSASRDRSVPIILESARELGVLTSTVDPDHRSQEPAFTDPAGEEAFAQAINHELTRVKNKDVVVYVHGATLDFYKSCAETAELSHFLNRNSVMIAFAWPTHQSAALYPLDKMAAEKSIPDLVALLEFLAERTDAEHIDILGYSAGGPLLAGSLVAIRTANADKDEAALRRDLRIGTVIFTSSDDDLRRFATDELQHFYDLPESIEVTVSEHDSVLILSGILHVGEARAGQVDAKALTPEELAALEAMDKLDVINVSYTKQPRDPGSYTGSFAGHSYWYENSWVSNDVLMSLRFRRRAADRGLEKIEDHIAYYFPHDYPQRLAPILVKLIHPD